MAGLLLSILDSSEHLTEIAFTLLDVQDWLLKKGFKGYDSSSIRTVLQNQWHLKPSDNSYSYQQYKFASDGKLYEYSAKGRYYKLLRNEVYHLNNLDDTDDKRIST